VVLDAEIQGLAHSEYLRVRVKYPDLNAQLIIPQESHLKIVKQYSKNELNENIITVPDHRLRTSVLVSHQVWTESSHIELSLVLDVTDPEVPSALKRWRGFSEDSFIIELCKPVRVLVSPKPIKRGI
jgi:integrator complex subunit 4